jgi:hypothetical protein
VYIGELEPELLPIDDNADETAHLDLNNLEVIKFKFANEDHRVLLTNKVLRETEGVAHDVFSEEFTTANQEYEEQAGREPVADYKYVYVPEVVREPRMHYWIVPRLGSFMAVPLVYKSCLNIDSFDRAVDDILAYQEAVNTQEEEKRAFETQQATLQAEKVAANEEFEPEEREWSDIDAPVVQHKLKKFVVCMDCMGQDRELTADQKRFVLDAVLRFKKHWEEFEHAKLIEDRDALLKEREEDATRFNEEKLADIKQREDDIIEKVFNPEDSQ